MLEQRMAYVHENPVGAGFVALPEQWLYGSAVDYYINDGKGFLDVVAVPQPLPQQKHLYYRLSATSKQNLLYSIFSDFNDALELRHTDCNIAK